MGKGIGRQIYLVKDSKCYSWGVRKFIVDHLYKQKESSCKFSQLFQDNSFFSSFQPLTPTHKPTEKMEEVVLSMIRCLIWM